MQQKAIAYVRFSSDEQADGDSIKRQTVNVTRYAERYGFSIEQILLDEGRSAYKGEHLSIGELGKFLRAAEKGTFRGYAFLIEEQDRLSRQGIRATLDVIGRFLDAGLELHVTEKSLVIRREEDLDNLAIVVPTVVNGSRANEYTKKLSERVSSARAAEREKARATGLAVTAKVPAWLKAEVGKKAVAIPEHAKTVARIFELAGLRLGAKRIVRALEEEKRRPFGKNTEWSPEYVQKILRSRAVLGEYQPHKLVGKKRVPVGEPISDYYPAVVTPLAFKAARDSVEAKTRFRKDGRRGYGGGNYNANLLFSPVYDRDNGVPMYHNPGKKGEYPRLESRWRVGWRQHSVRLADFEAVMLRLLPELDWSAIAEESDAPEVTQARAELDGVLSEIDRRKGRLVSLERLVAEGSFSRSLFECLDAERLALGDLSAREEKLAGTLSEARSRAAALHDPAALLAAIRSGAARPELRRRLKAEIGKRITRIELSFGTNVWTADGVVPDDADGGDTGKKAVVARLVFANGANRYAIFGRRGGRAVAYGELLRGRLFDGVWTENRDGVWTENKE
jgi:DNA invertase Pin-like site-specific DNA recombinase